MRMHALTFAAFAALSVGVAFPAHAEPPSPDGPLTFRADMESLSGTVGGVTIGMLGASAGLALEAVPRLTLSADLGIDMLRIGFNSTLAERLEGCGSIWEHAELSVAVGASFRLYDRADWTLDAFTEYESSLIGLKPEVTELVVATDAAAFDAEPYARRNVHPQLFWNRYAIGVSFGTRFGNLTPGISVAYQLVDAELDLRLTADGRDSLRLLGFDDGRIERRHSLAFWAVPITPHLGYALSDRLTIGAEAVVMPAGDSWIFGSGAFCRYRL